MSVKVIDGGILTTVQDTGRNGFRKFGMPVSGYMDEFAAAIANIMVGNDPGDALLEITASGPILHADYDILISCCGGAGKLTVNGERIPGWRPLLVRQGSEISIGRIEKGWRIYLSIAGGIACPSVMGSRSTCLIADIGGIHGRRLKKGDMIPIGSPNLHSLDRFKAMEKVKENIPGCTWPGWSMGKSASPQYSEKPELRFLPGSHFHYLSEESRHQLFQSRFIVSKNSNRMGCRLSGTMLKLKEKLECLSEAVTTGTIQLPPEGLPLILTADCQTIGGYPRIGQLARVDLPLLAQLRPGNSLIFRLVDMQEAERLYIDRAKMMHEMAVIINGKFNREQGI